MAEATHSTKNQIVIPREAREALQLKPGDKAVAVTALAVWRRAAFQALRLFLHQLLLWLGGALGAFGAGRRNRVRRP